MPCTNWKCCEKINDKEISLEEKRSKFILKNNNKDDIGKIKYDDCLNYSDNGKRCDYILTHEKVTLFIELKGNKFDKAILQLKNSIKDMKNNCQGKTIYAFVVASSVPQMTTRLSNKIKEFRKNKTTLEYQSIKMTKTLDSLFK